MKIAIVDDDSIYREQLKKLCLDYGMRNGCRLEPYAFPGGAEFLDALADTDFSIVFMDIYMEGMDGVTAARKLREQDSACLLVFLTSSMEFMMEAFSCHAFEYIAKPLQPERVRLVLDDALKILPPPQKFVEVAVGRKTVRVFLQEIVSITTDAHYLEFLLTDGSMLRSRMTVSGFLDLTVQDPRFILANRGVVLNAEHISSFDGSSCLMDNGERIPLRVRDAGRLEQAVRDYNFDRIRQRQQK